MRWLNPIKKFTWPLVGATLLASLLSGCERGPDPEDPYSHYNHNAYRLNEKLDQVFFKPVAQGYKAVTPYPVRKSVTNFFNNLNQTRNIANDALQARPNWMLNDLARFLVNSTVGVLGLFDPASSTGLQPHINTFQLTLDTWGFKNSPYVIMPVFGPSTTTGVIGFPVDYILTPWYYELKPTALEEGLSFLQIINIRALYLDQDDLAAQLAFDPYIFTRSAYFQHQAYLVNINEHPPVQNTEAAHAETAAAEQSNTTTPTPTKPAPTPLKLKPRIQHR